jgi:hypothetical protein
MQSNLDDPKNIVGLSGLLKDDDMDSNLDLAELEREIANGAVIDTNAEVNVADEYRKELETLSRNFDIGGGAMDEEDNDPILQLQSSPTQSIRQSPPSPQPFSRNNYNSPKHSDSYANTYSNNQFNQQSSYAEPANNSDWDAYNPRDNQLRNMTQEERKQGRIQEVFNDIDDQELAFDIEKERDEDDKASLLEQIDMLKITLEDDGVDISGIPTLTRTSSMGEVHNVYKILRLKNDRNRYCSFAEELILSGAYGMEYLFDGNKEWFGRKPDLTGWSSTVKVKLRRLRFETSTLVQEVMQEYNMSSGIRLALELFPSMFLYSRNRRLTQNDNLVSDADYKDAISNLNSM